MKYLTVILIGFFCFASCENPKNEQEVKTTILEQNDHEPIDSTLKKKLALLSVKDQTLRMVLPEVTNKFGKDSEEEKYFWSLIDEQDRLNEQEVEQILAKYGWLGKSRIGEHANQGLWLVIQHAPINVQEKYLPLLQQSVAEKESEGWHLAFLEDRILMRNDKKQIYGSQAIWDKTINKMKIYPIDDVANVNKRRAKLGLESVEEHAKTNGYVFDQF